MRRSTTLAVTAASLLALAAGCGGSGSSAAPAKSTAGSQSSAPVRSEHRKAPSGKRVSLHGSDYGRILSDGHGRALYLFTHDNGRSRCHGACAKAWPPFLTKGRPRATGKVKQRLLGTARRGRKTQATYAGHPLYYYSGDRRPGQVLCQAVNEFGGYWYVVKRSGKPVR